MNYKYLNNVTFQFEPLTKENGLKGFVFLISPRVELEVELKVCCQFFYPLFERIFNYSELF